MTRDEAAMDLQDRWRHAAATTLAVAGLLLLGAGAVILVGILPELTGSEGEHMAGDAALYAKIVVLPLVAGGLVALIGAGLLWRGSAGGVPLALLWVSLAGLVSAVAYVATGNSLSVVRMILVESAGWSVVWPELQIHTAGEGTYYSGLDDATFWIPLVTAAGAIIVGCFLVTGYLLARRRDRLAGPPSPAIPSGT